MHACAIRQIGEERTWWLSNCVADDPLHARAKHVLGRKRLKEKEMERRDKGPKYLVEMVYG